MNYIVQKANQKIWTLRRLKSQGASIPTLVELYKLFVRQGLEFAAPLWTFGLTQRNKSAIERIQANVTNLILGQNTKSYNERLRELQLVNLESRRTTLARACSDKMIKDERFDYLFPRKKISTTRSKDKYMRPLCHTNRLKNSAIPRFIEYQNEKLTSV